MNQSPTITSCYYLFALSWVLIVAVDILASLIDDRHRRRQRHRESQNMKLP